MPILSWSLLLKCNHSLFASRLLYVFALWMLSSPLFAQKDDDALLCNFTANVVVGCSGISVDFSGNPSWPTHQWDFGDGSAIFSSTSNAVTHSYANINPFATSNPYAPYILTRHRLNSSSPWCDVQVLFPGIFVGSGCGNTRTVSALLSAGLLPTTQLVSKNLYVFGNLEVDVSYTFDNCNIFMSGGGRIIVKSGAQLTLKNNTVVDVHTVSGTCENIWNGIEVLSGGTLYTNDATIQNAYFAVKPIKDNTTLPDLHLESTTFRRNFIGVYAGAGNFSLSWFRNNTFEGSYNTPIYSLGTCNTPASVSGISYLQRTYCGIYFSAVSGAQLLMPTLSLNNLFKDLQAGIIAINGTTSIKGCRFENIRYIPSASAFYQGTAVVFVDGVGGKHFTLNGLGKTATATINNCELGVFAYSSQPFTELWVSDCKMLEVMNGVELNERGTGNFTQANIKDNYIGCTNFLTNIETLSTGIEIKDPSIAYSYFNIDDNDIDIDQPEAYTPFVDPTVMPTGIQVTTTNNTTTSGVMILNITANTIHLIKGNQGIICENTENTTIAGNQISNDLEL